MPVTWRILPDPGLVRIRYTGFATVPETEQAMRASTAHPDFRPWYPHLVDLTEVTGNDRDFPSFLAMQALAVDLYMGREVDPVFLFITPTQAGREMVAPVLRTWDGIPNAVIRAVPDEAAALAILGLATPLPD